MLTVVAFWILSGSALAQPVHEPRSSVSDVRSDLEIKEDVRNALVWDARVNVTSVYVSVDDGVVTLTGEVPTPIARAAATEVALQAGVLGVRNFLRVIP